MTDDAFFAGRGAASRRYAFPESFGAGRCLKGGSRHAAEHRAAWEAAAAFSGTRRVVSLVLSESSEIAGIVDGRGLELSTGASPADGLPGLRSCGELDPTVFFELISDGWSAPEIEELAVYRSGLAGALGADSPGGGPADLEAFLALDGERARLVRERFAYAAVKGVGAAAALIGGLDALVVAGPAGPGSAAFVARLWPAFAFLGLEAPGRNAAPAAGRARGLFIPRDV